MGNIEIKVTKRDEDDGDSVSDCRSSQYPLCNENGLYRSQFIINFYWWVSFVLLT